MLEELYHPFISDQLTLSCGLQVMVDHSVRKSSNTLKILYITTKQGSSQGHKEGSTPVNPPM